MFTIRCLYLQNSVLFKSLLQLQFRKYIHMLIQHWQRNVMRFWKAIIIKKTSPVLLFSPTLQSHLYSHCQARSLSFVLLNKEGMDVVSLSHTHAPAGRPEAAIILP